MKTLEKRVNTSISYAPLGERANYANLSLKEATPEQQDICDRSQTIYSLWQQYLEDSGQLAPTDARPQSPEEYFTMMQAKNLAQLAIGEGVQLSHYPSAIDHPEGSYFVPTAHDARLGYGISNPDTPESVPVSTKHGAIADLGALSLRAHHLASQNLTDSEEKKALSTLKGEAVAIANHYAGGEVTTTECKVANRRDHSGVDVDSFTDGGARDAAALINYVERTHYLHNNNSLREAKLLKKFIDAPLKLLNQERDGERSGALLAGRKGYLAFASTICGGDMFKAYKAASTMQRTKGMDRADQWRYFNGMVADWHRVEAYLRTHLETGVLDGIEGYLAAADELYGGGMGKTYKNLSAVASMTEGLSLPKGWQAFNGTTADFIALREHLEQAADLGGVEGYLAAADELYDGDMSKTYKNLSAVATMTEGVSLPEGWRQFSGTTDDFIALREYLEQAADLGGVEGYLAAADELCDGDMKKTHQNLSAVANMIEGVSLPEGWQEFSGTTDDFIALREYLEQAADLGGVEGYLVAADELYGGDMGKTYKNLSAVATMTEGLSLPKGWQAFNGTTAEYHQLCAIIQQVQSDLTAAERQNQDPQTLVYQRVKARCQGKKTDEATRGNYRAAVTMSAA